MNLIRCQRCALVIALLFSAALSGCESDVKSKAASEDLGALRKIVDIGADATSVRWEAFGWPEKSARELLETNVSSIILVAEIMPVDDQAFDALGTGEPADIVPGAARPWLHKNSRVTLQNHGATSMDLSEKSPCRPLNVLLTKNGQRAKGFMCNLKDKALVYLVLESYT